MYLLIMLIIIGSRYAQVGLKEELSWLKMEKECLLTMGLLRMGQFPQDLSIKEISMINITRKKIGIYCKNREWGRECFQHIISQIPKEMIDKVINSKSKSYCSLTNGDTITVVSASDNARGYKFTDAIVQDGVDREILNLIVYPAIQMPVAVIRDIDEVVANYVVIKQELPHHKKFIRIKVRY